MSKHPTVAYFCMEYGLQSDFKIYSGGLGILAGDMLKAAKDLDMPVVGVGLKWRQGYTEQRIGEDGRPYDSFPDFDYDFLEDVGVTVQVRVRSRDVRCKVWKVTAFGNAPLYLLDTDLPENGDRWITGQLYGWFEEERLAQEIVLGVGGVRALKALGIPVDLYHFNEGHAVLAGLELIREEIKEGLSFEEAVAATKQRIVFTTHTPVKAGNETHPHDPMRYMEANLGFSVEEMDALGGTPFSMTVAALRLARKSNAVAELHGETAREMWKEVEGGTDILSITNGIHRPTWVAEPMLNPPTNGMELWNVHMKLKAELVRFISSRSGVTLNPDVLLIGFSRRAATYKRSTLLFSDLDRIASLFSENMLQIVFSGKAHPQDAGGKDMIQAIIRMTKHFPQHVVFLENYDMEIGRALTCGSDVWLNNPRRPLEACGTSGMKAAMNGVVNFSTLDGWWAEACVHGENGWAIGSEKLYESADEHDKQDAESLYDVLTKEIIPTYYNDRDRWITVMQNSIKSTKERYCAETMVKNYYRLLYG